jgi:hypothetical protein
LWRARLAGESRQLSAASRSLPGDWAEALRCSTGSVLSLLSRAKVDAGRNAAEVGLTEGLAYFEWSAADDVDVTDPATWSSFMPALGITVEEKTIAADLASMRLAEWRRAYANQWPDESDQGWAVIPRDVWMAAQL